MTSETKLQCYNRSCGQLFDPAQNTPESCLHHPGLPVFHDAYKKWSCCEKKTTDFTEFLNIKGCTKSYHSNVKPPEPPKATSPVVEEPFNPAAVNALEDIEESFMEQMYGYNMVLKSVQTIPQPLEKREVFIRPDASEPLVPIPSVIGSSLKPVLEKMKEITQEVDKVKDKTVQVGAPCQNKGCKETYKGEESNLETCFYHSGIPVFHEGLKYWSCCVKRTTDFNSFLEQVGCTTGNHKWYKDDEENRAAATKCRYDWHQTGNIVVISVYSKCPIPDLSFVEANQVKLHIHITFGEKKSVFEEEILLFGAISVPDCLVTYLGSKVEIKLKKNGFLQPWKYLAFEPDKQKSVQGTDTNSNQDNNKE